MLASSSSSSHAETEDECDEEDGEPGVERGSDLGCHGRVSAHHAGEHHSSLHLNSTDDRHAILDFERCKPQIEFESHSVRSITVVVSTIVSDF